MVTPIGDLLDCARFIAALGGGDFNRRLSRSTPSFALRFACGVNSSASDFFAALSAFAQWHHAVFIFKNEGYKEGGFTGVQPQGLEDDTTDLLSDAAFLSRRLVFEWEAIEESRVIHEQALERPANQTQSYQNMQTDAKRLGDIHSAICRIARICGAGTSDPTSPQAEIFHAANCAKESWENWQEALQRALPSLR